MADDIEQQKRHIETLLSVYRHEAKEMFNTAFFMKQTQGVKKSKMPPIPDDLMIRESPRVHAFQGAGS